MITYKKGDLFQALPKSAGTTPIGKIVNPIIVPHIVNNEGLWGSGFVIPVGKNFPKAKQKYALASRLPLGDNQWIEVQDGIFIVNMIAQTSFVDEKPTKYAALVKCMEDIAQNGKSFYLKCKIYALKFGSARVGGNWDFIEELIEEIWAEYNVTIFEYEEKFNKNNYKLSHGVK